MLSSNAACRKLIPIYSGFVQYFPDAIAAVAQLSLIANNQHNPGEKLHWSKGKSTDHLDAQMRHLVDNTTKNRDGDGVLHLTKNAWRALAELQTLADDGVDVLAPTKVDGVKEDTAEEGEPNPRMKVPNTSLRLRGQYAQRHVPKQWVVQFTDEHFIRTVGFFDTQIEARRYSALNPQGYSGNRATHKMTSHKN